MTIDIECACGREIEYNESETLYNEDYTPHEVTCPCCGAVFNLCIHIEFVKDGDTNKKIPDDDPEYGDIPA